MTTILLAAADARTGLTGKLEALGARVVVWPEPGIDEPQDLFALDQAIENLFGYDWLILKNERAAEYFLRRYELNHQPAELDDLKIFSIGEKTTQVLSESQIHVDVAAERTTGVFAALGSYVGDLNGLNILVPSANITGEQFAQQLEDAGARVDNVNTYRTISNVPRVAQLKALLVGGGIDCALFSSPQSMVDFSVIFDTDDLLRILAGLVIACGDAQTCAFAADFGLGNPVPVDLTEAGLPNLVSMSAGSV